MFYTGKIKYYNDSEDIVEEFGIFVDASTYCDAVKKIIQYYGEQETEELSLKIFSPNTVLEFDDVDHFDYICKSMKDRIIW